MTLSLQIVTPERIVFSEDGIDSVTLPSSEGELTILPSHAPLMTALRPGPLVFRRSGQETDVALSGGFMEIHDDKVVILADTAERSDEIDEARAQEARQRAADMLATREGAIDIAATMAALERASARIRVIERRRRRPSTRANQPPQQQ